MDNFNSYYNKVKIFRALPLNTDPLFRVDDYVTKSEKFAKEHAETSAIYNGEDYAVIVALVNPEDIKNANNPGEYKMVKDINGKRIWKIELDPETQMVKYKRII